MLSTPQILLHLTDTHILAQGAQLPGGIDSCATFQKDLQQIKCLSVKPQAVLFTGDLVDDGRAESYAYFRSLLDVLGDVPVYALPGNHDNRANFIAAFPELKRDVRLQNTDFIQYVVEDIGGVRLIAMDSTVPQQGYGELCEIRLQWLAETLAQEPEKPTIIAMHHPPFTTGMSYMDDNRLLKGACDLEKIVAANKQIQRLICGHQHRSCICEFGGTIGVVAPSASHQLSFQFTTGEPFGYTRDPSGAMIHMWQKNSPHIVSHLMCLDVTPECIPFMHASQGCE